MSHRLIPWTKVYQYYISNEKVSYAECAKKYNVSLDAVKKHGARDQWPIKKQQVFQAALTIMEQRSVELVAQRNNDHIALAKGLLGGAAKQLATERYLPTSARDVKEWIIAGVDIERRALNMDKPAGGMVNIDNPNGQKFSITWGDGESLDAY